MLSNEKPIKSRDEDFLNRKDFADNISNAIINYNEKNSLTIGLYGKWGSGKTSIVNMVMEKLEEENKILILNFEPWLFSNTEQLITNFFKEFAQIIKHNNTNQSQKLISLGTKLEAYASLFQPLSFIPEPSISILGQIFSKVLSSAGKTAKNFGNAYKKSITAIKKDIEGHLSALDKKIVIIIDDIDRLNNTEIKQVFQLIKALGNFPNTIYLSSMDKDVVVNALDEVQNGDGNEYLEKIINVPIDIPSVSIEEVNKFLFKKLNEILITINEEDFDKNYWGNIYHSGYKNFFLNIRDIIRYINVLRFNNDALKQKINIIDLMAITALQVFEPKVYKFIKENKDLLSGQQSDRNYEEKSEFEDKLRKKIDESKKLLQKIDESSYVKLMQELFLKIDELYSNTHYDDELARRRKDSKICSSVYFDAYFSLTLTEELSNLDIKDIIKLASNETNFESAIFKLIENKRISTFLSRLQDFTEEDITEDKFEVIFNVFINIGDSIPYGEKGMFSFGNSMQVLRILSQLYMRLEKEEEVFNLLKNAIDKSTHSIYIPCLIISRLMKKHGEYGDIEASYEKIISIKQLQELKITLERKIEEWTTKEILFNHEKALSIIFLWKRLNESDCINYIKTTINNQSNLINFLQIFIHYNYVHTSGDYTEQKIKKFNYKAIKDFINVKKLIVEIKEINKELTEDEQFCIDSFIGYYENKISDDDF